MDLKKILFIICAIFCTVSIVADIGFIWIHFNGKKSAAMVTTNISQLSTESKNHVFELKYFENSDGSGAEMFEIKLTAFTGINMNKTYCYGIQIINPKFMACNLEHPGNSFHIWSGSYNINAKYVVDFSESEVAFFNADDNVAYKATTALNTNNYPYVIDIDGVPYAFDFNKNYLAETFNDWLGIANNYYYESNFEYFVFKLFSSMSKLTTGEGVYSNLNVGLNDVFNIYEYNQLTGKFDKLTTLGYSAEYIGIKLTYIERGARVHSDSMFNHIGDSQTGGVIYG